MGDTFVFIYGIAFLKTVSMEEEQISIKDYFQLHEVDNR